MAEHFNYYDDWRTTILECRCCGWKGTFDEGSIERYEELMDSSCPRCPESPMLAIVSYPTIEESERNWSRLSASERRQVTARKLFFRRWDDARLRTPDQLPDLAGRSLTIVWDLAEEGTDQLTVLRHEDTVVWREPALWEGYERFREIVGILERKYGDRLADVVPTSGSELYLYGDKLSAPKYVEATLRSLRKKARGKRKAASGAAKKAADTSKRRADTRP